MTLIEDGGLGNFEPLERAALHEQILDRLKTMIILGRFSPGQRLPLRSLADSLGTSLMPVRDALQRLESVGVLRSNANRTMIVPVLTQKERDDIANVRSILESETASQAALHRSRDDLQFLAAQCDATQTAAERQSMELFLEANYSFHLRIAKCSLISFASSILEPLWLLTGPVMRSEMPGQRYLERAVDLHLAVFKAIEARDAEAARLAMRNDVLARPTSS